MTHHSLTHATAIAALSLTLLASLTACATRQPVESSSAASHQPKHSSRATGTFEVKLAPEGDLDKAEGATLARMSIDKQFRGDLQATSKGQMLAANTDTKDSAGYVAIERVTGSLKGRRGSFILQHSGIMNRGTPQLIISVVPDSATGQLTGLSGVMTIDIVEGRHHYTFSYSLPEGR